MTTSNEHNNAPAVPQEEGRPGLPLRKAYKHLLIVAPAQEPETLDLWCETCSGSGAVHEESQIGVPGSGGDRDCPGCDGRGYVRTSGYQIANKPAKEVGLTDETQTQAEQHSLRLTASGGPYVG